MDVRKRNHLSCRVRFVEDSSGEDGYRRLTMEDELAILQEEVDLEKNIKNGTSSKSMR